MPILRQPALKRFDPSFIIYIYTQQVQLSETQNKNNTTVGLYGKSKLLSWFLPWNSYLNFTVFYRVSNVLKEEKNTVNYQLV